MAEELERWREDKVGDPEYCCPICQTRLRRVSRRRDYFCQACHSVVEILDGDVVLVQRDIRVDETFVSFDQLRPPGKREER